MQLTVELSDVSSKQVPSMFLAGALEPESPERAIVSARTQHYLSRIHNHHVIQQPQTCRLPATKKLMSPACSQLSRPVFNSQQVWTFALLRTKTAPSSMIMATSPRSTSTLTKMLPAAIFSKNDGSSGSGNYYYVSNSESNVTGGAGSIKFTSTGDALGYQRVLLGTKRNCRGGGRSPYNTWLSGEENVKRKVCRKENEPSPRRRQL